MGRDRTERGRNGDKRFGGGAGTTSDRWGQRRFRRMHEARGCMRRSTTARGTKSNARGWERDDGDGDGLVGGDAVVDRGGRGNGLAGCEWPAAPLSQVQLGAVSYWQKRSCGGPPSRKTLALIRDDY